MLIPVTCSCGRSIGDLYDAFVARRAKVLTDELINYVDVEKLGEISSDDNDMALSQIFKDYKIVLSCCKMHLISHVNLSSLKSHTYLSGPPRQL